MAEFVRAASTSEISPGQARLVTVKGKEIVLFNVGGAFFALDNASTHEEGPLAEGSWATRLPVRGMARRSTSGRERSSVPQLMKTLRVTTCVSLEPTSRSRYSDHAIPVVSQFE